MYVNKKAVKEKIKESGKRCSQNFLNLLDRKIDMWIEEAIYNAKSFKTITDHDLV